MHNQEKCLKEKQNFETLVSRNLICSNSNISNRCPATKKYSAFGH